MNCPASNYQDFLLIFLFLSIGIPSELPGQSEDWSFMPRSFITTTLFEEGNYIWIGDYSGITKMHKETAAVVHYNKVTAGLPDQQILCGAIDSKGIKYFGTLDGGVLKFDGQTWTFYDSGNSPLPKNQITQLSIDGIDQVWVSGSYIYFGLCKYDGTGWTRYTKENSALPEENFAALEGAGNGVWLSSKAGLSWFDGNELIHYSEGSSGLFNNRAIDLDVDEEGNLWLAYLTGWQLFDGSAFHYFDSTETGMPKMTVTRMEIDSKGIIWLEGRGHPDIYGYSSGCVASYDGETWKVHDASNSVFSEEWLFSLFISDDGEVWTGNRSGKVYRKMESGWKEYDPSVIKYDDNLYVQSIVFDHENHPFIVNQPASGEGGTIIKCSVNTGKAIMDLERGEKYAIISDGNDGIFLRGRNKVRHYTGSNWAELPDPPHTWWLDPHERLIELDGENRLWIDSYSVTPDENLDPVTHFGVAFLENGTWTRYSYENSILEDVSTAYLCMDIHGDPWIASNNELFHYDGYFWNSMDAGEAYYALPAQARKRIVADKDNTIWVPGNSYGILSFDGLTSTWYPHPDLNQYAMGVNDIAADSEGTVWMTSGFYLLGFDGSNWTTFHWENSPLPYFMNLTAMGIDRYDNIWLATSIGIFKYHKGGIVSDTSKIPSEKDITILPNPVQDVAEILLDRYYDNISIHLVDMFGRVLGTTQHMRTDRIMVPCSHLGSGMYMIKLVSNDREIWTGQMIKL